KAESPIQLIEKGTEAEKPDQEIPRQKSATNLNAAVSAGTVGHCRGNYIDSSAFSVGDWNTWER
ncbi:hypothetical protein P7K49_018114, partial [Saguinus oedipus]